jgi:hypothetical protein
MLLNVWRSSSVIELKKAARETVPVSLGIQQQVCAKIAASRTWFVHCSIQLAIQVFRHAIKLWDSEVVA